jgi:hypothetical protein
LDVLNPELNFAPLPLPPLPPAELSLGAYDHRFPFTLDYARPSLSRPRVWTVAVVFLVALLAGLMAGGIVPLAVVAAQSPGEFQTADTLREKLLTELSRPAVLLASGAATQVALLLTALGAAILSPVPLVRRLRLHRSSLSPFGYIVAPIGGLAVAVLFSQLVTLLKIPEGGTLKVLSDSIRHLSPVELVFAVLIIGIAPGFAEEFVFRGYIQTRLVERWGRWVGIVITAVLFGIMHMDVLQGTFVVGFGLYIGYVAEKAGSIRPTMVCHAVNNSIQVLLGRFSAGGDEKMPPSQAVFVALIALAVLVLCTAYIYFRVNAPADHNGATAFPAAPMA